MYDLMKKMEPLTCLLPTVIDRLVTLQELHEGGSDIINFLLGKSYLFYFS